MFTFLACRSDHRPFGEGQNLAFPRQTACFINLKLIERPAGAKNITQRIG